MRTRMLPRMLPQEHAADLDRGVEDDGQPRAMHGCLTQTITFVAVLSLTRPSSKAPYPVHMHLHQHCIDHYRIRAVAGFFRVSPGAESDPIGYTLTSLTLVENIPSSWPIVRLG
jgi:hypothetical protein